MISKKIQKISLLSVAVTSAASFPFIALASDEAPKVEEMFVTISRIEQPLGDVIASVSQFDGEDIQHIQPYDLNDMFELLPGVDVLRTGSRGSNASLQVRGSSSGQTLMLVNGMRIASATLGTANYNLIPPEMVGRVEIMRGSASALYGSDAIGGVVNVFVAPEGYEGSRINLGVDYGSHNYHRAVVAGNISSESVSFTGALVQEQSNGINNLKDADPNSSLADKDGYERLGGTIHLSFSPDENSEISYLAFKNSSEYDFDNLWAPELEPYSDAAITVQQLSAKTKVNEFYQTRIGAGYSTDESDVVDQYPSDYKTTNTSFSWLNDFSFAGQILTLGYEQYLAEVEGSTEYVEDSRKTDALFAQINGGVSLLSYSVGLREDDIEGIGKKVTPSAGLAFNFLESHQIYVRYAEGFRAPTFNDQYYPWGGNENLKPEESKNAELGYKLNVTGIALSAAVFDKDVTNLIQWEPNESGAWSPINIGKASLQGVELAAGIPLSVVGDLTIAADYIDALDTTKADDTPIDYRAKKSLRLSWIKQFAGFEFGVQAKLQSERKVPESSDPSGYIPGYGIVNGSFAYQINDNVRVQAKLNNILDKEYSLNPAYNEDGRNVTAGVKISF